MQIVQSSKFLVSKDVRFDELTMLSPTKKQFNTKNNPSVRKKVEFKPKVSRSFY